MPSRARLRVAAMILFLPVPRSASAQQPPADPRDVSTVEAILHTWYDVLNGPAGAPRQWRRDSTLYAPGATFVSVETRGGKVEATTFTPEQFRRAVNDDMVKNGFYETEIGFRIERFGNLAQVRSVYETRRAAGGPLMGRGVNYLLLYWDGARWWVTGATWQDEDGTSRLPASWVGKEERAP